MKKLLYVLLLVVAIASATIVQSYAADRCAIALHGCLADCSDQPIGLQEGCATGCNIGYLLCKWHIAF